MKICSCPCIKLKHLGDTENGCFSMEEFQVIQAKYQGSCGTLTHITKCHISSFSMPLFSIGQQIKASGSLNTLKWEQLNMNHV